MLDGNRSRGGGPTEVEHFVKGTGIEQNSTAMLELMGNWSETTWAAAGKGEKQKVGGGGHYLCLLVGFANIESPLLDPTKTHEMGF